MKVTLPPELEQLVKQKVADGEYASTNEVIREALGLLREHDALKQYRLEELRREIAMGLEQADRGELALLDAAAIKLQARQLLRKKGEQG